ncbi:hypothetical protein LLG95_00380 [bacterium]|nr:hypothetical protein [bacterium]
MSYALDLCWLRPANDFEQKSDTRIDQSGRYYRRAKQSMQGEKKAPRRIGIAERKVKDKLQMNESGSFLRITAAPAKKPMGRPPHGFS